MTLLTISDSLIRNLYKMKVITLDEKKAIKQLDAGEKSRGWNNYWIISSHPA